MPKNNDLKAESTIAPPTIFWSIVVLIASSMLAYIFFGHAFVRMVYEDLTPTLFGKIMSHRDQHPVTHYLALADQRMIGLGLLLFIILMVQRVYQEGSIKVFLIMLLFYDAVYGYLGWKIQGMFNIELDGGNSEWYQYLKEASIALILFRIFKGTGLRIYYILGLLFMFFLVDDAFQYHERAGWILGRLPVADFLSRKILVRSKDIGELMSLFPILAITGAFFMAEFHKMKKHCQDCWPLFWFVGLLFCLGFFGIIVDQLGQVRLWPQATRSFLNFVEDFSEMLMMSIIWAYSLHLFRQTCQRPTELVRN